MKLNTFGLMAILLSATALPAVAGTLADMKPMKLRVASLYGPDNWFTSPMEAYTARIEARTEGKITFEYFYAGSLVPTKEMTSALGAGLFDFGFVLPSYEPAKFSVDEWQGSLAIPTNQNPILEFATTALSHFEWTTGLEAHTNQFTQAGIQPVMPSFSISGAYGLLCKSNNETLADMAGKRSRVAGSTWTGEAQNLGLTPVSLPITEVYQAFQSGVIDCWMGHIADAGANGVFDHGKYFNLGIGLTAYSQALYGFNKDTWDSFPEDVKDIIWDETAAYAAELLQTALTQQYTTAVTSTKNGVTYTIPDAEVMQKVQSYHDAVRAEAAHKAPADVKDAADQVNRLEQTRQKWQARLEKDLGFGGDYDSWSSFISQNGQMPDFAPLKEIILNEIVLPYANKQK